MIIGNNTWLSQSHKNVEYNCWKFTKILCQREVINSNFTNNNDISDIFLRPCKGSGGIPPGMFEKWKLNLSVFLGAFFSFLKLEGSYFCEDFHK